MGVHPGLNGVPAYVLQPGPELLSAMELISPTPSLSTVLDTFLNFVCRFKAPSPAIHLAYDSSMVEVLNQTEL